MPKGWKTVKTAPNLRVVGRAAALPATPPMPSRRAAGSAPAIAPIPEPCFEPSVIDQMPKPPMPIAAPIVQDGVEQATASSGRVVVMFGCRGGAGTTTLAVNTALSLVKKGKRVCVVDLDLQLGDVFVALDMEPQSSIAAVAREASTIDAAALKRRLARHDSGIYALTQVGHIDDMDEGLAERMPALISTLTDNFDYVIVDGVRDFSDYALSVLDMADQIAMVLTQDVPSVRRAARAIQLFRRLGYNDSKLRLTLNRCERGSQVTDAHVSRALGMGVAAKVREDAKRAQAALNDGALICHVAPTSRVAKDIDALTEVLRAGERALASAAQTGGAVAAMAAYSGTGTGTTERVAKSKSLFGFLKRGGN
jgi:Flp pilus assembly CpaE family ATPase